MCLRTERAAANMSFKCQIFKTRLTFHNVLELSCDVRIIIFFLFSLIAILPPNIKCAKLSNPQIRLLINDEDLLHEKTARHEAAAAGAAAAIAPQQTTDHHNSGEHFNLYRSELKRLSYETIHRILRDENEPSYRREETELRYYQKRSPAAYQENHHSLTKRSVIDNKATQQYIALNYSKRKLREFLITPQIEKELQAASSLDLSDNHLSSFPLLAVWGGGEHLLTTLNLSNNSFAHIPLTENTTLKSLNLNGNIIEESPNLPANVYLHELYLSANQIENISNVNLSLLKNLEILDVSCNRLQSTETSFFPQRMHNLKHLNMAHNRLSIIFRETFYNLLSLNTLLLAHNNISDIDYETFLALPNLQYLDLSHNRLKGKSIRALQGITGLVALNIAFNPELGPFMQEFVASWSLKELDASGTGLCQIPAALAQSVRSLKLTHNWLKIINCGDLDSYPLLQYLDLSFSHIEHIEDDALGRLEILEVLMLDNNQLTKIPVSLPVSLEHLFLQNNNIMDIQSQSFQGLKTLKTLDLSHNKLLYLPDISLPKLQTLNLQFSEITGISQGIVHTLPRLNELLLEDNPIKCSDLLGIAEWASTCRLRAGKEEQMTNEGSEAENDEDEDDNDDGRVGLGFSSSSTSSSSSSSKELRKKFEKIHNFYDKFGGEYCQKSKGNIKEGSELLKPLCAIKEEKSLEFKKNANKIEILNNLKRSPASMENFDLNSMIGIPLPAKKAVKKTLSAFSRNGNGDEEAFHSYPGNDEGITTASPLTTLTRTTSALALEAAARKMHLQIEQSLILSSNNNNTNNNNNNTNKIFSSSGNLTKPLILTKTLPAEAKQTFEEFAFKDQQQQQQQQQQHSKDAMKTFATTTIAMTDIASQPPTTTTSFTQTTQRNTLGTIGATSWPYKDKDSSSLDLTFAEKEETTATTTKVESLQAANLYGTLKENKKAQGGSSIKKDDIKDDQTMLKMAADGMETIIRGTPAEAAATLREMPTAINISQSQRATEEISASTATPTTTLPSAVLTTITTTTTTTITNKSKINPLKEILQNEKAIKTKIGPTNEIKSLESSSIIVASALSPPPAFITSTTIPPPTATTTTTTMTMAELMKTSLPIAIFEESFKENTKNQLPVSTTTIGIRTSEPAIPAITKSNTLETWPTESGDNALMLGPYGTTMSPTALANGAKTTSALHQDKNFALHNDYNNNNNNNNNSNNNNNMASSKIGQDNGHDDNKTLVISHETTTTAATTTARPTMPIISYVDVLQSNENQTLVKDSPLPHPFAITNQHQSQDSKVKAMESEEEKSDKQQDMQHQNSAIQHPQLLLKTSTMMMTTTPNDVNAVKCMQSNAIAECISSSATKTQSSESTQEEAKDEMKINIGRDIGIMPTMKVAILPTTTTTTMSTQHPGGYSSSSLKASEKTSTPPTSADVAATVPAPPRKHEPLQLHIKDRHLIGTPLLMHKGDNLMVAADELLQSSNSAQNLHKMPLVMTTTKATSLAPSLLFSSSSLSASTSFSSTTSLPTTTHAITRTTATSSSSMANYEFNRKIHTLDKSQNQKFSQPKMSTKNQRHHEPLEHKGETIKDKDYVLQYKKSNAADMKTKKPSLIMKKMTIITKQHEPAHGNDMAGQDIEEQHSSRNAHIENEIHHQKDLVNDAHYQELKPLNKMWESVTPRHSTVNTPINKKFNLPHEPQTFQHEHDIMLQQILHEQHQQHGNGKASQSQQWSDLRKTNDKENHPGLILLVSSGLFVVLLLGLMHVYRCDVPWRRNSPAHHLRPHQRHNGSSSLEDDVHSFLSYNEGMQKWHHSARLEAPYSSPLHNLHVRELQKTSATEKAAAFKPPSSSSSYNRQANMRTHILPRTNSQSSSATTRTTSPSSSAILDDETFYVEMTPSTGQFAQALQSELLPMELLNMVQATRNETKETSTDFQYTQDDEADFNAITEKGTLGAAAASFACSSSAAASSSSLPSFKPHQVAMRSDLLAEAATTSTSASGTHSTITTTAATTNNTLFNHIAASSGSSTRKFGLW